MFFILLSKFLVFHLTTEIIDKGIQLSKEQEYKISALCELLQE